MCNIYLGKYEISKKQFVKKIWDMLKEMSFAGKHLENLVLFHLPVNY
jgi:hypothetical protein